MTDTTPQRPLFDTTPRMSRRRVRTILAVLVLVVLVAALLAWRSRPFGATPEVGEVLEGGYASTGSAFRVEVPGSSVQLEVGVPVTEVPTITLDPESDEADTYGGTDDDATVRAERGQRLVPIAWSSSYRGRWQSEDNDEPVTLVLVAGDRRSDLGTLDGRSGSGSATAVVEEDDDLAIEVAFDGLVQTVHLDDGTIDAGLAAPLYGAPRRYDAGGDCSRFPGPGSGYDQRRWDCSVGQVELVPWTPDQGWVEDDGQAWATVDVGLADGGLSEDRPYDVATLTVVDRRERVLLDGVEPADVVSEDGYRSYLSATWLVTEPPSALRIERRYEVERRLYRGGREAGEPLVLDVDLPLRPVGQQEP